MRWAILTLFVFGLSAPRVFADVYGVHVTPHWLEDGQRFWFFDQTGENQHSFVLVDAKAGTRRPAFDHERVAEALGKQLQRDINAQSLPVQSIEFAGDGRTLRLWDEGVGWELNLENYALAPVSGGPAGPNGLPRGESLKPSRAGTRESRITFVNQTDSTVRINWCDTEARLQFYFEMGPGERRAQHTFAGHAWAALDEQGRLLGVFEAIETSGTAIISPVANAQPPAPPGRQRRHPPKSVPSPDGRFEAIVKDHNLYLRDLQSGEEKALTQGADQNETYTQERYRDPPPKEERQEAMEPAGPEVYWSPDSKKLVALRTHTAPRHTVYIVSSSPEDQLQPKLLSFDYLKPGDEIPIRKPHLFDVDKRAEVAVADRWFSNPFELDNIRWLPDSSRFTFVYNQRGHQVLRIVGVDASSGEARPVVDEGSRTFIDYSGKKHIDYLDETREIIWMSERDGWNHLYLYDADSGALKNQITRGEWVVRSVDRVDIKNRQIWFQAGGIRAGQDPYFLHACRVNFDGSGLVILTEGNGTHTVQYSPLGDLLLDTWSRVDQPPVHELRRANDGSLICEIGRATVAGEAPNNPEPFVAKGRDGVTDIYGVIHRPRQFDPQKKYPVLEHIYAGPQSAYVPKSFSEHYEEARLTQLGFIVVQIDGMGTSQRSKAFHDYCWKNLADAGFADRIAWIRSAAEKYPYMDLSRVGIYGGSAGGQNAMGALLFHGDFYKAAVADCGCHDNRMDKIWWNEQWMGWPLDDSAYEASSNVKNADRLQGNLMLIVGELDHNVDPASTMQVVNALVKADKDFDLLVIPGEGHGAGSRAYGKRRTDQFFVRHLHPDGAPAENPN